MREDIRYALRMLLRNPGFTTVALAALALGIGVNTAVFSVVNAVLIRRLPFPEPDRLVVLWEHDARQGRLENPLSPANFLDWQRLSTSFDAMGAWRTHTFNVTGEAGPERLFGAIASRGFFQALAPRFVLGRGFTGRDPGPPEAVISAGLWKRRFGGAAVIGTTVLLGGKPYTVCGVLAEGQAYPPDAEIWVRAARYAPEAPLTNNADETAFRGFHYLKGIGRLRPRVTPAAAEAELNSVAAGLERAFPETNTGQRARLVPLRQQAVGSVRLALLSLLAAVSAVLLIACGNVANLLLARAADRGREMAVRTALGAERHRIVRQLMTESVLLALFGGGLGLMAAAAAVRVLAVAGPPDIPRLGETTIDWRVLVFTLTVSLFTGLLFGAAPALESPGARLVEVLRQGSKGTPGGSGRRFRQSLVIGQIGLSLVLLTGSGLLVVSLARLLGVELGFQREKILTAQLSLYDLKYVSPESQVGLMDRLVERLDRIPGVRASAAGTSLPLDGNLARYTLWVEGQAQLPPRERPQVSYSAVGGRYFEALGIPLMAGRFFDNTDRAGGRKVLIVSAGVARRFLGGVEGAPGKRLNLGETAVWYDVVGVVGDVRHSRLDGPLLQQIYAPFAQRPWPALSVLVRTDTDPRLLAETLRKAVHEVDPDQPVHSIRPMEEMLSDVLGQRKFQTGLLGAFAAVAAVLAAIGVSGVMAAAVASRTREFGVRMALGAQGPELVALAMRETAAMVGVGLALGVAGSLLATKLIAGLLYGTAARDPSVLAGASVLLGAAATLAGYLPARRAARIDPSIALRCD